RQLTIFNTQATISIGGNDRQRPYQGQLSGLYYNGLKVLKMAAEGNPNVRINGSVRLVGDVPSLPGATTTTSVPPEMSTTYIETTTTLSTTTTRRQRSPPTIQTTDDIVSSAECSSDDEDLEECDSGHAGGELVIPVLVEDPVDIPPIATRPPYIPLPPTLRPLLTVIDATRESLLMATAAGVPCLSDQGGEACDDDKTLSTSAFEGGFKAQAPKWEAKDFRPNKASVTPSPRDPRGSASPPVGRDALPKLPAGKMNNREPKPQPDVVLLPFPTSFEMDSTKPKGTVITSPMFRNVPTASPTESGVRRIPGASEVIRESSSTTGMVVGIVSAAALCILILLYAMYKYRNRDEGSYQVDETRNYISNSAQTNGVVVKDKTQGAKGGSKRPKDKDKEYYV
ncbi:hypothetical protein GJAV_G00109290, partial [Gymnothorax javanicus]